MGFFDKLKASLDSKNNQSPFGEAGLLFDPLAYLGDAVGKGDEYRKFMRKTWEYPNKYLGEGVAKFNKFDRKINPLHKAIDKTEFGKTAREVVENKPADVIGSIFGGGAIFGGLGGGASGGAGGGLNGLSTGVQEGAHSGIGGAAKMPMNMQMPQMQQEQPKNTWLADELERQRKEKELKNQIAKELGPRYV